MDADGVSELVFTSAEGAARLVVAGYWSVWRWNGSDFEATYSSLPTPSRLEGLVVAQVDGDAQLEILIVEDQRVSIFDGSDYQLEQTFEIAVVPTAIRVADINGDLTPDLIFCDEQDLYVYDLVQGRSRILRGFGGLALDVGQVDDDPALEIAIANGSQPGQIVDGAELSPQISIAGGFGSLVKLLDLNDDGFDDVVVGSPASGLQALDLAADTLLWTYTGSPTVIRPMDLDGDSRAELVVGERSEVVTLSRTGLELARRP